MFRKINIVNSVFGAVYPSVEASIASNTVHRVSIFSFVIEVFIFSDCHMSQMIMRYH